MNENLKTQLAESLIDMGFKMKFVAVDLCNIQDEIVVMFERDGDPPTGSASNSQDQGSSDCDSKENNAGSWFHAAPPPAPKPKPVSGGASVQHRAGGFSRTTFSVMNNAQTQAERPFVGSLAAGRSTASTGLCVSVSVTPVCIFLDN